MARTTDSRIGEWIATARLTGFEASASGIGASHARVPRVGTMNGENIYGTQGDDRIEGLGGSDRIYGWDGEDVLFGGDGHDTLDGERGRDVLYGGEGEDRLYAYGGEGDRLYGGDGTDLLELHLGSFAIPNGSRGLLDGGAGDDWLRLDGSGGRVFGGPGIDRLTSRDALDAAIDMGTDNDIVWIYSPVGRIRIDLGDGNDSMELQQGTGRVAITMGAGDDALTLSRNIDQTAPFAAIVIKDFGAGQGDSVSVASILLEAGVRTDNAFRDGYLRLAQRGDDTLLSFDRDLDGLGWERLIIFRNTDVDAFTGRNFDTVGDVTPADSVALAL